MYNESINFGEEIIDVMQELILYLVVTALGYFLGSRLRAHRERLGWTSLVQTISVIVLVLLMGMRMGANEEITANLDTIGIASAIMTVLTVGFSIGFITVARKMVGIDRFGRFKSEIVKAELCDEEDAAVNESLSDSDGSLAKTLRAETLNSEVCTSEVCAPKAGSAKISKDRDSSNASKMTFFIVTAVSFGMLIGYFVVRKTFGDGINEFDDVAGLLIKIGLCILLGLVGLNLGVDGTVFYQFKKIGARILVFPIATILGTLVGSLIAMPLLKLSINEALSIGAGFGWYTLAPGMIMDAGYVSASAISFLHNVLRELSAIILIPLIADKVGYIETTGMPGAAAMDVCLPIVERSTRSDIAVYSFVSGVVLSFAVPILVRVFLKL